MINAKMIRFWKSNWVIKPLNWRESSEAGSNQKKGNYNDGWYKEPYGRHRGWQKHGHAGFI